ncbi:MAG: ATP-binding cassette domain-containing protein [Calditrichia bacterium]
MRQRFYDPQTGRITADNHDIKSLKIKSLRDQITILMQEAQLFYKSVAENIAFGKEGATTEEIIRAAKLAQAHDFIENMPNGYETMIEEGGENLSGGQKQRINIARAMIRNTPILILDEPTTALDAKSESLVHDAINVLTRGKTTFVIAHKLSTIRDADKILVLDKGQMVGLGKHDELLENCEPYRQLCRWQFGMGIDTAPELSGIAETAPLKP